MSHSRGCRLSHCSAGSKPNILPHRRLEFSMTDELESPFLTIDETAQLLRVNRRTLDNHRWNETGPPFRRHGGRIVYHRDEVLEWSKHRRVGSPQPVARNDASTRSDGYRGS